MVGCEKHEELADDTKALNRNVTALTTQLSACVMKLDQIVVLLQGPLTGGTGLVHDVAVLKEWRSDLEKLGIFDIVRIVRVQTKIQWGIGAFVAAQVALFIFAIITGKVTVAW